MILANCRCHTALSAFSMPNEASIDHNWHSWKICRQTCFPIIFNCQTFCTNKCRAAPCRTAPAGCARVSSMTSFEAIRVRGWVVAERAVVCGISKEPISPNRWARRCSPFLTLIWSEETKSCCFGIEAGMGSVSPVYTQTQTDTSCLFTTHMHREEHVCTHTTHNTTHTLIYTKNDRDTCN